MSSRIDSQSTVERFFSPEKWELFDAENGSLGIKISEAFALAILILTVLYPVIVGGYWLTKNCCCAPDSPVTDISDVPPNHQSRPPLSTPSVVATPLDSLRDDKECNLNSELEEIKNDKSIRIDENQKETWSEMVFDEKKYNKTSVKTSWKLHIAPGKENSGPVLKAISKVLKEKKPFCKIITTEQKINDINETKDLHGHKVHSGKFITIYPKTDQEALELAIALNTALIEADLPVDQSVRPSTDRPIGPSYYLWARHDLAGNQSQDDYEAQHHVHACAGNYQNSNVFINDIFEITDTPSYQICNPDIFEELFGKVQWKKDGEKPDQGSFINAIAIKN